MEKNLKKLTLLHSNDMHGDFLAEDKEDKLIGGVSMLSGYVGKVREEEPNTLYCIAGDMFRGSVIDSDFMGLSTIEIMNMISPDIVTLGNHETDYGVAHLLFIEKCAKFPIVNANLHIRTNGARLFNPCKVIEIDGMKILFIGILTEEVINQTRTDAIIGSIVDIEDAAREVGKICNAYHATDIDFTVLLTHIGFEEDKALAAKLDPSWGIDVIVGGHSHTFIDEPAIVNDILIVQAGTGTDQIGRFDLTIDTDNNCVDSWKWQTVAITPENCPRDEELENLITRFKSKTDEKYGRVVTRFNKCLTHPERTQETELGDVMAEALRESLNLDIMLLGSGSIRKTSLGPIVTLSDLTECFPYSGNVFMVRMTGRQLKEAIRYMLRDGVWRGEHCEFYQFSDGFRVTYSVKTHAFTEFSLHGETVADEKLYTVGLQNFHFLNVKYGFNISIEELEVNGKARMVATSDRDILDEYFSAHQHLGHPVDGRLTVLDKDCVKS